jgi:hypothetical protein
MTKRNKRRVARFGLLLMTLVAAGIGVCLGGAILVGLIQMSAP